MLLAVTCPVCGAWGRAPCDRCAAELRPARHEPPPAGVDVCHALLAYEGAGRELVARLKYRNHRGALAGMGAAMASLVGDEADELDTATTVTWAPTSPARRRQRGFDQGELLARAVARRLRRPARRLLVRLPGPPQTGRSARERRAGPRFTARGATPRTVLLVDDVITTGATASAAAQALRGAGAEEVWMLAAARTPSRHSRHLPITLRDACQ